MDEQKLLEILSQLEKDEDNKATAEQIKNSIARGDYDLALKMIGKLKQISRVDLNEEKAKDISLNIDNIEELTQKQTKEIQKTIPTLKKESQEEQNDNSDEPEFEFEFDFSQESNEQNVKQPEKKKIKDEKIIDYPKELRDEKLEQTYVGLIICNPKNLALYAIPYEDNYFASSLLNQLYKLMIFGEGQQYCPERNKRGYNFTKETERIIIAKEDLKEQYKNRTIDIKKIYVDLMKLFVLRKNYLKNPIESIQEEIANIKNYVLYDKMSIEEVAAAVDQVLITQKFKQSILNTDTTKFLINNDNNLTTGLKLPFSILSESFKGIRKGETFSIAMPSNSGKSRLTMFLCAYIALVYKKKVLLISNEMSEEKMKLCLITTIINNPEIQKIHGYKAHISESELLEFKFKPDPGKPCHVDEKGYVLKENGEKQFDFAQRLYEISTDFKNVFAITQWFENEISNQIYFINIIDHTKEELKKVITNFYYKDHIEYMFYDTMKADTDNIGLSEELKKTATILSNLAQEFEIFIGSTLQIKETTTLPINLTISDLSACNTVKEVLDILCMFKQIMPEDYDMYEYVKEENSDKVYNLEKSNDINDRYYACVVDKNRAGGKPKLLFKLNLAYNSWEELGYLRLKPKT